MQKATGGHLEVLHGESKAVSDQVSAILLHIIDRQGIGFDTIWVCKTGTVSNPAALVCTRAQSSPWCIQCRLHQTDLLDVLCKRSAPLGGGSWGRREWFTMFLTRVCLQGKELSQLER
jgi:hypothetical protein